MSDNNGNDKSDENEEVDNTDVEDEVEETEEEELENEQDSENIEDSEEENVDDTDSEEELDESRMILTFAGLGLLALVVIVAASSGGTVGASLDNFDYIEGMDQNGSSNISATIQAHNENLRSNSYTISLSASSQSGDVNINYKYDKQRSLVLVEEENRDRATLLDYTDSQGYEATGIGTENESFNRFYLRQTENQTETSQVEFGEFIQASNLSATEVTTGPDGETVVNYEIVGTAENIPDTIDIDGNLQLSQNGYFTLANVSITQTGENQTVTSDQNIEIINVGSTNVEDPSWFDDAQSSTEPAEEPDLNVTPPQNNTQG